MAGVVPGVLAWVLLRCVLGLLLRMREFVGLVDVGTAWGSVRRSVGVTTPSVAATGRPSSTASIAARSFLIMSRRGFFFNH